ncbi:AEC family transporter [Coprothermobacteraceae bacterium]|nr:AEC family transporter [Coprothermobacteraceae bacterium]
MAVIVSLLLLIALGYVLRAYRILDAADGKTLYKLIFDIALPALAFQAMYLSTFDRGLVAIAAGVLILHVLGNALFRVAPPRLKEVVFAGWLGNTAFMGYPIVQMIYGQEALVKAVVYDQTNIALVILLWIGRDWKSLLRAPFIGMALGFLLHNVPLPSVVLDAIRMVASLTSPLAMIYTGFNLNVNWVSRVVPAAVMKLAVLPAIGLAVAKTFGLPQLDASVFVLQAGMPTMVASVIFGQELRLDTSFLSKAVVMSTIVYPLALWFWQVLLR